MNAMVSSTPILGTTELRSSPAACPFLGHLGAARRDVFALLQCCVSEHGDVVPLRLGWRRAVLVNAPELIDRILVRDRRDFDKHTRSRALTEHLCGRSMLTALDPEWREQRRRWQPVFHADHSPQYRSWMRTAADRLTDEWNRAAATGQERDVAEDCRRLALTIAAQCLFGWDTLPANHGLEAALPEMAQGAWRRLLVPIPDWWPSKENRRFQQARHQVRNAVAELNRSNPVQGRLDLNDTNGQAEWTDEILTLLLAGHETTANTLAWACWHLTQHPDWARRVAEDSGDACAEAANGSAPPSATRAVLRETLRLHPPIWLMERRAVRDTELAGHRIPAGTSVLISPWALHRNPQFWDHPNTFDPARWSSVIPKAWLPFGGGPRRCIGEAFAELELHTVLPRLWRGRRLILRPGHVVRAEPGLTLRLGGGFPVTFETTP